MNDNKLVKLSTLLQKVIYQKKWQQRMEIHNVFHFWARIVGSEVASHARPQVIHGNVLWVEVSDSAWMQQLQFMKYELLKKINEELQPEIIEDIRFRMGFRSFKKKREEKKPEKIKVDVEKKKEFEQLLEGLPASDSRQALKKLWLAFAGNEKVD